MAQVLRDLFLLKLEKELSFGERKMLDTAKGLLVKEISIAKKMEETKVEENIKRIFKVWKKMGDCLQYRSNFRIPALFLHPAEFKRAY